MLYTIVYKKKLIVEADCADDAQELAENGCTVCEEEEIYLIRPTTKSERIWFDLTTNLDRKEDCL